MMIFFLLVSFSASCLGYSDGGSQSLGIPSPPGMIPELWEEATEQLQPIVNVSGTVQQTQSTNQVSDSTTALSSKVLIFVLQFKY